MNLREAYLKAIELPIKNLPNVKITRIGAEAFWLREDESFNIILTKDIADIGPNFYLTMEDLMSDSWEVEIELVEG